MMSESQDGILKLIFGNMVLIGIMLYIYPQFAESEYFTDGAVTILYGISIISISCYVRIVSCVSRIADRDTDRFFAV